VEAITALHRDSTLCTPRVGVFRASVAAGDAIRAGRVLGTLKVLNRRFAVLAPAKAAGEVFGDVATGPQEYGSVLVTVGARSASGSDPADAEDEDASASGWQVTTPIDGIFYLRPSPDAPAYVKVGDAVSSGQTLGLVEVMKTFNPIRYGGAGAPERGRVVAIEVGDNAEVAAGDVLMVVEEDTSVR